MTREREKPDEHGLLECAEEDSNLHGEISPQGPQPDRRGVRLVRHGSTSQDATAGADRTDRSGGAFVATGVATSRVETVASRRLLGSSLRGVFRCRFPG